MTTELTLSTLDPMTKQMTDTERLDWLESQGNGNLWVSRQSSRGEGYRLHNTSVLYGHRTAREAIDADRQAQEKPE